MKVLLDIDGVLADYVSSALDFVYERTSISFHPNDITIWNIFDCLGLDKSIEKEWENHCGNGGVCSQIKTFPGAKDFVQDLNDLGCEVVAVTTQMNVDTWTKEREEWLIKHFKFDRKNIIFTSGKHHIKGDFFIDDSIDNCIAYKKCNQKSKVILFEAPYNRNFVSAILHKAKTYDDIIDIIVQ